MKKQKKRIKCMFIHKEILQKKSFIKLYNKLITYYIVNYTEINFNFSFLYSSEKNIMKPQWTQSQIQTRKIHSIDFSVLSPNNITQISQAEVNTFQLYQKSRTPVQNGPLDLRMGVGHKSMTCKTCQKSLQQCVGHFGHAKINLPIFHIGYFKHLVVVLKMICKYCSNVLLDKQKIFQYTQKMKRLQKNYITRLVLFKKIFKQASKNKLCSHCHKFNPVVQKVPKVAGKIQIKHPTLKNQIIENSIKRGLIQSHQKTQNNQLSIQMNPWQAKHILSRIPQKQLILINISGETSINNFIIDHLIVPPVCIRPSVMLTNNLSNQDDLTIKIKDIMFLNKKIKQTMIQKGEDFNKINKAWYLLQSHWSQLINADSPGLPLLELKNKYIRSFCTRLKGKQGRFRQNLSGKRSNYTARTVISPDPNLHPSQVIVPQFMSKILTIRQNVNVNSLQFLQQCVEKGNQVGGANFIITKNNQKIIIGSSRAKIQLKYGDIVQRHLRDGDVVIFNRQPSLHRISMMGFRVKVAPGKTLRFNQCVCAPFNADFDGDQMNIHVPQTLQARSQTLHLMGLTQNIVTPKSGQPIVALMQDFLTTSFLLTSRDIFLKRDQFTKILSWFCDADQLINLPPPTILKPVCLWTGKQVMSTVLRPNKLSRVIVNFQVKQKIYTKNQYMCQKDGWVLVKNSELLLGQIGKTTLGGNKSGLIYNLLRDNTNEVACDIMQRISKLSSRWLSDFGMTIGISDVTPSSQMQKINKNQIKQAYQTYESYLLSYKNGNLQAKPGMSQAQSLQSYLNHTLSKVRQTVGQNCINHLNRYNKPLIMALCGSKGSSVNLSQMIGCVGQQTVGGKRIKYGFTERSLPHFTRLLQTPQARGFVKNSFFSGLTATQFFFHTMGGRQGIIDTAVKTADTGYMQRRLIKLIEDIGIMYDYTVRTCDRKQIIQFRYGDDGLDPMRTQQNKVPINFKHLQQYVKTIVGHDLKNQKYLTPKQIKLKSAEHLKQIKNKKLIVGLQQKFQDKTLLNVKTYFDQKADALTKDLQNIKIQNTKDLYYLKNSFNGITDQQLAYYFEVFIKKMNKCIMQPGQAIGAITAQSIGQPATQMTLKTFHFAGISSMNITQGVPRVNQIINNTKNIATPIITIHLNKDTKQNAIKVKNNVQKACLGKILHSIQQIYGLSQCSLRVIISKKTLQDLQLAVNINMLKKIIDSSLKSKIKKSQVLDSYSISIIPMTKTNIMFQMKTLRRKLVNITIGGILTIHRALISKLNNKHVIYAQGLGLKDVLKIDGIDKQKSFSNHITEIQQCLGIEAARQSIINQITQTMRDHGVNVNSRHINLLSEVMTCKGRIIGFTRNGVDKMKDSTMMLASFQKTTDFLFDAATQGKHDRMRGVSQRIIMGQPITIGTGMFDLKQQVSRQLVYGK